MGLLNRILGGGEETIARARRPQELAASLGRPALEGLEWLGRRPSRRAPLLYRLLVTVSELVLYRLCAIRLRVVGRENLPQGGYILAAAIHRNWIDPLVVLRALPREPRPWFMGGAPTVFDRRWKERLLHRLGGFLPVWRGGADVGVHIAAASAVIEEEAVLVLFFEGAVSGPPDRVAPASRAGAGLLALRTGAPIVPFALAGTRELYRGKRIGVRILPAVTLAELLGEEWPPVPPPPGTRDELRLAHRITRRLAERIDPELPALLAWSEDPPHTPRRWRWLSRLLR
ncbi:MAG TPA: lysophospholipid acyltransferase family protein [Candidatus Limnocylindria bacterium]|nr:lysophospholipid acyltransferase family protein [Candidatus Limnocylindria bacterium]